MKKTTLHYLLAMLLLAVVPLTSIQAQSTVTIGTGTTTSFHSPVYISSASSSYYYSNNIMLFTPAEIGMAGNLIELAWNKSTTDGYTLGNATFKIYVKETTATSVATSSGTFATQLTGATLVYDNSSQSLPAATGWVNFTLTTPFAYSGSSNLMVLVDWYRPGSPTGAVHWYYTNTPGMAATWSASTTPPTISYGGGYTRPNTQMTFAPSTADDAGMAAITSPVSPISPGTFSVKATIRNYGADTLYSANIGWSVNGVAQTGTSWTGVLEPAAIDTGIVLGNYTFPLGTHEIKAWTSLPNGQFDSAAYNDTTVASIICAQVLNGIYTIGGVNPDYPSFTAAITDLNAAGVSGPVTFNVAPGTYNEQMTITEVLGGSATNTVTFQSSTGNANDVIVSFTASSTNNWTVNLDGADYITLQNLTFEANDGTYARVVVLQNGANYNVISGCKIISNPLARSNSNSAGIYDGSGNDEYNVITGNDIQNGYYGIYSYGSSTSSLQAGCIIENNTVIDFYYYGIHAYYHMAPKINNNEVRNHSSSGIVYGLRCAYCDEGLEIQNNTVETSGSSTQYALYVYYCDASPGNEGLVANNMVSVTSMGTGTHYGAYWYYNNYQRYYHNSLHLVAGSTTGARAAYIYNGANNESYNNIFSNHGGGYTVYVFGTPLFLSNNNNYYSSGTTLGYWGSAVTDLLALQTASGQDVNSVSLDPEFSSPSLLYPGSIAMDNLGTPLTAVPMDIYGNVRSLTTPDMGCMEYTPPQNDVGIISIDSPTNPQGPGVHTISATLQNFGLSNLNTATLNFSVNGGPVVSNLWVGFLTQGGTDGPVTIGTYNFPLGTHQIKVWASNPNLVPDENNLNDTMVMSLNVCQVLSGTFTIGDTSLGADYPSFNDAFGALSSCGINGTVTFSVQPGTYTEQLTLVEVPGASASNRIIFTSSTGNVDDVILSYSATGTGDNWTVFFNGADYISLENITIKADDASNARVIVIQNGADFNVISGCKIISNPLARGTSNSAGIYEPSGSNDNYNVIVGNLIQNGYYGIYSYGSGTTSLQAGTIIENNVVEDFYYYGVYLYYHLAPKVNGNDITNHSSSGIVYGLNCAYCEEDMEMQKNRVVATGSSSQYAMRVYYCTGTPQAMGLVANNMVSIPITSTSTHYGTYWYYSNYQRYYNNSHYLAGGSSSSRAAYIYNGSNSVSMNNIFANSGGGYSVYHYGTPLVQSDYNNYYSTGTSLAYWGSNVSDLMALQAASGMDTNAVSMDPLYSIPDLLFPGSVPMDNLGTPLMDVSDDYYGNPRSLTTPDIGCVEYTPPQNDAGIVSIDDPGTPLGPGIFPISATIKNFGLVSLTSCNVNYSINGGPASTSLWSGNLAPDSTEGPITLGNFNFTYGSHQLKVWTSDPNNTTDGNHLNDTMEMTIVVCDIVSGTFTIGDTAQGADFATFQSAVNSLTSCGIDDTVLFVVDSGSYNEQLVIPFIPGSDSNARVIFQSATGNRADVVLHYAPMSSTESYVVLLDDADYISFKDMTLTVDAGASYGRTVYMQNGADHNEFINCEISTLVMTSSLYSPVYSPNTTDEYNLWDGCDIKGGYYAMYLYGTGGGEMMNIVRNCSITDWYYYGVYLYYQNTPLVTNNYVKNSSASGIAYAIRNYYCYGPFETSYNTVELDNSTTSYGIYVYQSSGGNTPGRVYNNSIVKTSGTASYLLYIGYSSNVQFYHNTVHSMGTATSGYGMYFTAGSSNIELVNNIITTAMGYPIYLGSATYLPFISVMDYNNIYTAGPTLAYATTAYATLSDWQAYSGLDSNSVSSDPGYLTTTNLTPSVGTINNLALPVAWITDDINGTPRAATPDMGAYEFDPLAYEAEMIGVTGPDGGCDLGFDTVKFDVLNRGALAIDTLIASYEIKGGTSIVTETFINNIQPNDTATLSFANLIDLSVLADSVFEVRAWISISGDPVPQNDTSSWKLIQSNLSPPAPQVANVTINQGDSATLLVLNPDTNMMYSWYDVLTGGTELATGDTFVTPPLSQTTVYYVEGNLGGVSYSVGPLDPSIGAAASFTALVQFLQFDVLSPSGATIQAFDLYPTSGPGQGFTVVLQDASSNVLASYSDVTTVASGQPQTVFPNLYAPQGTGYKLGFSVNPGMTRNSTGGVYPYVVPNIFSITGNTFNVTYYYFFYNMFVGEGSAAGGGNGCPSPRAADTVFVIQPIVSVNAGNDTSICLGDSLQMNVSASGGVIPYTYSWSPAGSLTNATIANPVATPITNTTYSVTVTDQNGDTGTDDIIVLVNPGPNVNLSNIPNICIDYPAYALSEGTPVGGVYSGPGVSAGAFDPAVAGAGTHTITYTYTDPLTGCSGSATNTVTVDLCIGLEDLSNGLGLSVYPNPSKGDVVLTLYSEESSVMLSLIDVTGKVMLEKALLNTRGMMSQRLDLSAFPAGVYYIRLQGEEHSKTVKLVLQ